MTLAIKLDGNWSSFQLANSTPPLSVTDSAIAPSARMPACWVGNLILAKETDSNVINASHPSSCPPCRSAAHPPLLLLLPLLVVVGPKPLGRSPPCGRGVHQMLPYLPATRVLQIPRAARPRFKPGPQPAEIWDHPPVTDRQQSW